MANQHFPSSTNSTNLPILVEAFCLDNNLEFINPTVSKSTDPDEEEVIEDITSELAYQIFERVKTSDTRFSIHISPKYNNFGAVAHVRVIKKSAKENAEKVNEKAPYIDENLLKAEIIKPSVQRGRQGALPHLISLKLDLGDELVVGTLILYVGVKKAAKLLQNVSSRAVE